MMVPPCPSAIIPNMKVLVTGAAGFIGSKLMSDLAKRGDEVVGMVCVHDTEKDTILVVSEKGFGKRSYIDDYRITNRGGKGVKTLNVTEKTGKLTAIILVNDENDLMIINKSGTAIRIPVDSLRVMGRATQGVKFIELAKRNDAISSVCRVMKEPKDTAATEESADISEVSAENNSESDTQS